MSNSELATSQTKKLPGKKIARNQHLAFDVTDDYDEARDIVENLLKEGHRPLLTVPPEHLDFILKHGVPEIPQTDRSGRGENYSIIAARLGSDPYFDKTQERYLVQINPEGLNILPRLTGPDKIFAGTIVIEKRIPPENLEVIGRFNAETYKEYLDDESGRLAAK